jgi:O-Antigen ligase
MWWLVATVLFLAGSLPMFGALAQQGSSASDVIDEYFDGGHLARPDRLVSIDGFTAGDNGWYLSPGASGRLVYRIPRQAGSTIGLSVWLYAFPGVTNAILASTGNEAPVTLLTNVSGEGVKVALPHLFDSAPSVVIEIDARNSGPATVLVIDQLETYVSSGTEAHAPPLLSYLAFGGLVGLVTLAIIRRRPHALAVSAAMGVIVASATATRFLELFAVNGPLDPDAIAYRVYADRVQWWPFSEYGLFSGNFSEREPLFPMVVHAYFQVLGSSDFHLRVVSVTLSIAVVVLSVVAARRLLRWPAALLVGFLVAVSGPLIQESVRGLRLELEMVVLLVLYLALDRGPSKRPLLHAIAIGVIGAAMVLTRTYYLPVFVVAVALTFLVRYRPSWRTIGLISAAVVIMIAAEGAHRIGLYEHHGDALFDTAGYDRWNANVERFALGRPLPHPELFPTAQQYQQLGPYFGPKISTVQYLFVIHSPLEFVRDSLAGSRAIFDTIDGASVVVQNSTHFTVLRGRIGAAAAFAALRFDLATRWLILLGLMAMVVRAIRRPHLALIPLMVVSWVGLTAFLFDHGLLERYRHTWQTMPLALIAGAWLLQSVVVVAKRHLATPKYLGDLYRRFVPDLDLALFAVSLVLALAQTALHSQFLLADALLLALAIGLLTYRRPAAGTAAMLLAVSVGGNVTPIPAEAAALVGVVWRVRPPIRSLAPLIAFVPFGLAVLLAGGRPSAATLDFAASMLLVAATVAVAVGRPQVRERLMWLIAAIGPLAGLAYVVEPTAPTAIALVPVGAAVAAWLYMTGHRWALALGLLDLVVVVLVDPLFAWLGVLVAVAWLAWDRYRWPVRRKFAVSAAALVGLIVLGAGASLAATTPPPGAAWFVRLTDTSSSIRQRITVDRASENSIWFYGRRASTFSDNPVVVDVNGASLTTDLNPYLPSAEPAWIRLALPGTLVLGEELDIQVRATGQPDPINRYIEIGGVYATAPDLTSAYSNGSQVIGADGTYLIVLGDDSQPLAPGGLPEPLVQGRWQPPLGQWMPGERSAPTAAREQANTLQLWSTTLNVAAGHPLGLGTGTLATALLGLDAGVGPGLSARNEFLQAAAEWGLPGLAGLVLLIGVAAWQVRRSGYRLAAALLLLILVSMAGESLLADSAGAVATWVTVALCLAVTATGAASPSISAASGGEKQR